MQISRPCLRPIKLAVGLRHYRTTVSPGGLQADGAWRPDGRPRHKAPIAHKSPRMKRPERAESQAESQWIWGLGRVSLGHDAAVLTPDGGGHTEL